MGELISLARILEASMSVNTIAIAAKIPPGSLKICLQALVGLPEETLALILQTAKEDRLRALNARAKKGWK